MIASATSAPSIDDLHAAFLAILPRIVTHGEVVFRRERCPHRKQDCLAEMVALSWRWFVRLVRQGKHPLEFVSAIATFAARQVRAGRKLCGKQKGKDVMNPRTQQRHGITVTGLPQRSTLTGNPLSDALRDSTQSSPDELAAFRVDFPEWLARLGQRNRALALDMAMGHRTEELAQSYGVTCGRVSQLRRSFHDNWLAFHGEPDACPVHSTS